MRSAAARATQASPRARRLHRRHRAPRGLRSSAHRAAARSQRGGSAAAATGRRRRASLPAGRWGRCDRPAAAIVQECGRRELDQVRRLRYPLSSDLRPQGRASPGRGVAQLGRALRSGRKGRRFKSSRPDQFFSCRRARVRRSGRPVRAGSGGRPAVAPRRSRGRDYESASRQATPPGAHHGCASFCCRTSGCPARPCPPLLFSASSLLGALCVLCGCSASAAAAAERNHREHRAHRDQAPESQQQAAPRSRGAAGCSPRT
jgi:hypothetical protein